mgnify:CR=1 FL=1
MAQSAFAAPNGSSVFNSGLSRYIFIATTSAIFTLPSKFTSPYFEAVTSSEGFDVADEASVTVVEASVSACEGSVVSSVGFGLTEPSESRLLPSESAYFS